MIAKDDIHIFMPAYNEGQVIGQVIRGLKRRGYKNIYVVNDGSKDDTAQVAGKAGAKVIHHVINRGAGAASQTAIAFARLHDLPYLIFIDSDGQHQAPEITILRDKLAEGNSDIVVGSRFLENQKSMPFSRKVLNFIGNLLTNIFCKAHYTDSQSGCRMLNRKAIEKVDLRSDGFSHCSEMLLAAERQNLRVVEAGVKARYSDYSLEKGQNWIEGFRTALNFLWRVVFKD